MCCNLRVISHLNVSSVHSSDGGLYRCQAENTVRHFLDAWVSECHSESVSNIFRFHRYRHLLSLRAGSLVLENSKIFFFETHNCPPTPGGHGGSLLAAQCVWAALLPWSPQCHRRFQVSFHLNVKEGENVSIHCNL